MHQKIITILIIGILALTSTIAFAAENYNSSRSNTSTAIVNQQVGDILLRYGIGGAKINEVTDILAVGIDELDLKELLIGIGIGEEGVNEILTKLDSLGTKSIKLDNQARTISTSNTGGVAQIVGDIKIEEEDRTISGSGFKSVSGLDSATGIIKIKDEDDIISKSPGRVKYSNIVLKRGVFQDTLKNIIQNIKSAAPKELENLKDELKTSRGAFQTEILSMSLSIRENAEELRENFRENVRTTIGHVDHGKTARIAVAHGKSLRMLNRFRSAISRFEHILNRLESRVEKLETRGIDVSLVIPIMEEAKNMQINNEAKMETLKAKYELLLEGKNSKGIGKEARIITEELKLEIQTLHAKLKEIVVVIKNNIAINEEGLQ